VKTQRLAKVSVVALVGLVGTVGLAFPGMAFPDENDASPTITILVYNMAKAPPDILREAEREERSWARQHRKQTQDDTGLTRQTEISLGPTILILTSLNSKPVSHAPSSVRVAR
jgi:hypothetical protein